MRILSIETSCDETAAAIVDWDPSSPSADESGRAGGKATVLANTVSSQASLHAKWGGVVPDLASREHIKNIVPVIEETLEHAHMTPADIDLIAVTQGPGLIPALLIGVSAAKTLSLVWQKPLMGVHHLEGHIYANFLSLQNDKFLISNSESNSNIRNSNIESKFETQNSEFPLIALVVSGGHTQLVLMRDHFQYEILGETQDDAAGEAFDKVAKMLGLPYPGGPVVAKRADSFRNSNCELRIANCESNSNIRNSNIESKFKNQNSKLFPRPMINSDDFNFSFSGLKTSVLYTIKKIPEEKRDEAFIDEICHEFQEAVVDVLVGKTKKALELYSPHTFVIAGGVSANERLRNRLRTLIDALNLEVELPNKQIAFLTPEFKYSLDNAAMIGVAAAYRYEHMNDEEKKALMQAHLTLDPDANLPLR